VEKEKNGREPAGCVGEGDGATRCPSWLGRVLNSYSIQLLDINMNDSYIQGIEYNYHSYLYPVID
jgi:hypothetical protein